jgi:lipoprotein-anchoring transpeptidase ErfK/SrfK
MSGEQCEKAVALKKAGQLVAARELLQPVADSAESPDNVLDLLGDINTQILFSPVMSPEKVDYTIQAGDGLGKLAAKFGTTITLIKKSNNLKSDVIRIGDRLRIYQPQFAVGVDKTKNTLTLTDHGRFFKRYRVGTGEYSKTPVGTFKITVRQEQPVWHRDGQVVPYGDPANILGTHWLGLDIPGYGIHGTWATNSIGKQATAGCVRLLNGDVEELYTILPLGTPVTIHE